MPHRDVLACDVRCHGNKLIDRDHLLRADIYRSRKSRPYQTRGRLDAFVDKQKRTRLLAVAPYLYFGPAAGLRDLSADSGGSLLPAACPGTGRPRKVLVAGKISVHSLVWPIPPGKPPPGKNFPTRI